MQTHFVPLTTVEELGQLFVQSQEGPVLLFNHDPFCPISRHAYEEMSDLRYALHLVNVSTETQLTAAISAQTGVRHESPQVIVLFQGAAAWSASHFRITRDAVEGAVQAAGGA